MAEISQEFSITKLTIPIGMVTAIIGGSAWLSNTRSEVLHVKEEVRVLETDFKVHKQRIYDKLEVANTRIGKQDERLSRIEGKIDLLVKELVKKK